MPITKGRGDEKKEGVMGQELLYVVMPRINFTPSQLAYNRRVAKSDRSQCRNYDEEEREGLNSNSDYKTQDRLSGKGGSKGGNIDESV